MSENKSSVSVLISNLFIEIGLFNLNPSRGREISAKEATTYCA